jgi:hypothetical protein
MTEQSIAEIAAREQRTAEVIINGKRYRFDHHLVTGRRIKEKAGIPDSYSLYLRRPGDNEPIADDEEVTLREGDVFFSRPPSNVS